MPSPLFTQLHGSAPQSPILQHLVQFKKSFNGNPQQMVQQMLNSGRVTQSQINQYAQQANEIYRQLKNLM